VVGGAGVVRGVVVVVVGLVLGVGSGLTLVGVEP